MPVTNLTDKDVVELMRKEFERKLSKYCEENGIETQDPKELDKDDDDDKDDKEEKKSDKISAMSIAPGLRVKHEDSQLVYTVVGVNLALGTITLRNPEKQTFDVAGDELETEYVLD